ncbi:MAG: histidine phosphatase family protein [Lachnospiraceae bacterium]|nr:histidine phosphatase family protein [Lachnospiraceae bacterium]MBR4184526.1 histidine phosphatase family protein [Clostridia bacterium]
MIYIIRHGKTEMNRAGALQGRSDHPLNEEGIAQAEKAGELFRTAGITFDRVYSSPLIRAVQTAQLATADESPEIVIDDRLIEMDYGPYEGMTMEDPAPEVLEFFRDFVHNPAPDGMEQLSSVTGRLGEFLEELRADLIRGAAASGDGCAARDSCIDGGANILISTHAIAMKGALEYLTPASGGSYWSKFIGNCAVYVTEITEDGFTVPVEFEAGAGTPPEVRL